jgi:hypothetical protein
VSTPTPPSGGPPYLPTATASLPVLSTPVLLGPYYAPGNTATPKPPYYLAGNTATPTPKPFTWKDAENLFDEVAEPDLMSDWNLYSPRVQVIKDGLAVLWSIKEFLKSPTSKSKSYYNPYSSTPTPYMRTPTPSPVKPTPARTPYPTPNTKRIPHRYRK